MLETQRLYLRPFRDEDLPILYNYRNHPMCSQYQRYSHTTIEELQQFIAQNKNIKLLSPIEQHLAVALKNDELVGDVAIYFKDQTITIGYTISNTHQRQGYAFEILSTLVNKLHEQYPIYEIVALSDKENKPSIHLLLKLGFINEGYVEKIDSYVFCLNGK